MKPNLYQLMESALEPGEVLLWTGHPYRRSRRSGQFLVRLAIYIALTGVSATFFYNLPTHGELSLLVIPMIIAGLVGIESLWKLLIFDPRTRGRTCYGITECHALIISGYRESDIRTVRLRNIDSLEIKPNRRGHGSIKCYAPLEPPFGKINKRGEKRLKPLFRGVTDVYAVHELLERQVNLQKATRVRDNEATLRTIAYEFDPARDSIRRSPIPDDRRGQ
jgi:hypothetical protein